jgi:hypothetical protein
MPLANTLYAPPSGWRTLTYIGHDSRTLGKTDGLGSVSSKQVSGSHRPLYRSYLGRLIDKSIHVQDHAYAPS